MNDESLELVTCPGCGGLMPKNGVCTACATLAPAPPEATAAIPEKKPSSVTVIGAVWIALGCLQVVGGLGGRFLAESGTGATTSVPWIFHLLAIAQPSIGAAGVYAAISFLNLKAWSRGLLEVLSWLLIACLVGSFIGFLQMTLLGLQSRGISSGLIAAYMSGGAMMYVLYIFALVVILVYLRGEKIRSAMRPAQRDRL